jgi:hypothetical protein
MRGTAQTAAAATGCICAGSTGRCHSVRPL